MYPHMSFIVVMDVAHTTLTYHPNVQGMIATVLHSLQLNSCLTIKINC